MAKTFSCSMKLQTVQTILTEEKAYLKPFDILMRFFVLPLKEEYLNAILVVAMHEKGNYFLFRVTYSPKYKFNTRSIIGISAERQHFKLHSRS